MNKAILLNFALIILPIALIMGCVSKMPSGFKVNSPMITDEDIKRFHEYVDTNVEKMNYEAFENILTNDFFFTSKVTKKDIYHMDRTKYLNGIQKVYKEASQIQNETKILNIFIVPGNNGAIYEFEQIGKTYYGNHPKESYGIFEVHVILKNGVLMVKRIILKAEAGSLSEWNS